MSDVEIVVQDDELSEEAGLEILSGEELQNVVTFLKDEYDSASTEMEARNQKMLKWRKNMEAVASDAPKHHPFKNSSNVTVPVTQTVTQNLFAKVKGMFDAREPLWRIEATRHTEEEIKKAKTIEKYLNILAKSPFDLNMSRVLDDLGYETILTGGSFPKVVYSIEQWRVKDASGASEKEVIWHDGPAVVITPVERVKYRRGAGEISRLPWIAVDTPLTEVELRERASRGVYDPEAVALVLGDERTTPTDLEEQRIVAEAYESGETLGLYDVSEVWFYWDIDGSGVPVDLFFTVHFPTGAVLKQQYNTLGTRFLTVARYVHRPYTLTGRGTGQMTESMQDEVTIIHNMRNDNMKIANMRMIGVKRGSGFGAKREIYPGAVWEFDNPREDVFPIQLGEIYPSSLQAEQNSLQYAHRAVGLSESQMGFSDSTMKSRDTWRGREGRVEDGNEILQNIVSGLRDTVSEIGMLVWMQCIANKERVIARERTAMRLNDDELEILEDALSMELSEVPMRMAFSLQTTDADKTYEQQRENVLGLMQVYNGFAEKTLPLAMQLYSPQGMQMQQQAPEAWGYMARVLTGASKLMEDTFRFFGIYNTQDYVVDSDKLDQMLDMMRSMGQTFGSAPQLGGSQVGGMPPEGMPPEGAMPPQGMPPQGAMPMQQGGMM